MENLGIAHLYICGSILSISYIIACIYAVIVTPAASHDSVHYKSVFVCSSEVNRNVLEIQTYRASLSPPIYQLLT